MVGAVMQDTFKPGKLSFLMVELSFLMVGLTSRLGLESTWTECMIAIFPHLWYKLHHIWNTAILVVVYLNGSKLVTIATKLLVLHLGPAYPVCKLIWWVAQVACGKLQAARFAQGSVRVESWSLVGH